MAQTDRVGPDEMARPFVATAAIERNCWGNVCALQTNANGGGSFATAFLVRRDADYFLVTAAHAARDTHRRTRLLYFRRSDSASRYTELRAFFPLDIDPWRMHGTNDLAVARIDPPPQVRDELLALCEPLAFDFGSLAAEPLPRTTPVEIVGFPMQLGTAAPLAPLVVNGSIASRPIVQPYAWGRRSFLYVAPAAAAGTSGGPVLIARDPQDARDRPIIAGMYVAVRADKTGPKLSEVVPAFLIRDAIEAFDHASTASSEVVVDDDARAIEVELAPDTE